MKFTCHYQLFNAALREFLKAALAHSDIFGDIKTDSFVLLTISTGSNLSGPPFQVPFWSVGDGIETQCMISIKRACFDRTCVMFFFPEQFS